MNLKSLKNKYAVITGCNKGIGRATLEDLSNSGVNIFACTRNVTMEFKKFSKNLEKKNKVKIYPIKLDLSNKKSISNCVNEIYKISTNIDILVNNAG